MATTDAVRQSTRHAHPEVGPDRVDSVPHAGRRALAVLRIAFGLTFLWAFFDKLLGLGFSTPGERAWIRGGDPTFGYLTNSPKGPLASFYHSLAGDAWVSPLFMFALLAVGVALLLGIGLRITAVAGGLLYLMMWSVALPPATNPVLDDHILGLLTLVVFATTLAGDVWGLGAAWSRTELVRRFPVLR